MKVPFVDLEIQIGALKKELDSAIASVISEHAFIGSLKNKHILKFQESFADYIGVKHVVACGNGTDALEILIKSLGIGPGDEVIVPALSWIATSEAVSNMGAKAIFVDIEHDYYTIDPKKVEEKITSKTKAIIPVHIYGHPADMKNIMEIASRNNIFVIEDAAQAHGAEIDGQKVGSIGITGAFSFYPGKNLGAFGDAGSMVTNSDKIALTARMISQHGQPGAKHKHTIEGRNSRMDGLQAAILNVKLPHLEKWTESRIRISKEYIDLLKGLPIDLPETRSGCRHVFHLFVIRTNKRDELQDFLNIKGVSTSIQYPKALPFLDAYAHADHLKEDFPVAASYQDQILSLPMYPELKRNQIEYVCECIREFFF